MAYFLGNLQISQANNFKILRIKNANFSGYCFYMNTIVYGDFQICIGVLLIKGKIVLLFQENDSHNLYFRSSHPEVFLGKGILKICSTFTGKHPCRCAISIKLQSNFIKLYFGMVFSSKFAAYFQSTFF